MYTSRKIYNLSGPLSFTRGTLIMTLADSVADLNAAFSDREEERVAVSSPRFMRTSLPNGFSIWRRAPLTSALVMVGHAVALFLSEHAVPKVQDDDRALLPVRGCGVE